MESLSSHFEIKEKPICRKHTPEQNFPPVKNLLKK